MKNAYFAGGCFWCIASCFNQLEGVKQVLSGFSGGEEVNPSYEQVKAQETSHRETIKIIYDENKVSYERLLDIFIENVDPFDEGGQFIDRGHSYSLAIYYENEKEKGFANEIVTKIKQSTGKTPYISIEKFKSFYLASEYHQDYNLKHPEEFEKELIESGRKKTNK